METRKRTFLKAIFWHILGLGSMAAVGLLVTGSAFEGGTMAVANTIVGFGAYLLYERLWAGIGWGRMEPWAAGKPLNKYLNDDKTQQCI